MTKPAHHQLERIVWQRIHWPQPLEDGVVLQLLRAWANQAHAPLLILEARASREGIQYLVGSQLRHSKTVRREVEKLVAGSIVVDHNDPRPATTSAGRVTFRPSAQPLQSDDADGSTRTILAALTSVTGKEILVVQLVLGPRVAMRLTPSEIPEINQPLGSLVTSGLARERRADVRRQVAGKRAEGGFSALVRLGVSASEDRAHTLTRRLVDAFRGLSAPGMRLRFRSESVHRLNHPASTWPLLVPLGQHLSVSEIGRLSAWPLTVKDSLYPGQPPKHPRQIRPSFAATEGDRVVGVSTAPGTEGKPLGLSIADSTRHFWTMGPTGVGKSSLLLNLLIQDLEAGRGMVVVEPKDLVHDLLHHIPKQRREDVILLDPLDPEAVVGLNPLHLHGRSPALVADQLFSVFQGLYGNELGPRSSDILRNSLFALASSGEGTLAQLPFLLSNRPFRERITRPIAAKDPLVAGPFWHWFENLSPESAATITAPLMNKLRPLLSHQLRHVLGQARPRFNLRQVLEEGKALLVPLQKGTLGPEAAQLLGALVVADAWAALQERTAIPPKDRHPVSFTVDEVQEYLRLPMDLGDALALSRSLGACFHLAHQFLDQLPIQMRTAFEANARSRVFFQLARRDAKAAADMAPGLEPEDFMALPVRHVYAQLVHDGSTMDWASGRTNDTPAQTSNPASIRKASRTSYGVPIEEIEAGFQTAVLSEPDAPPTGNRRRRSAS
ncbi:type IV secretory system conjugative DNA transfer family protein [Arthrobacter sp. RAF14]|uniref:type IV secretory system conjugative DNA transfer family protein n=1 Tax=Arthrobacter sp. RAF14 TaxID=3233051 RepID=UPI003F912737